MNLHILKKNLKEIDQELSNRFISLDPKGYFIIKVDLFLKEIIVEHYLNNIDSEGYAVDPATNKPIKCNSTEIKNYSKTFKGKTAKEVGILITEKNEDLITKFDHALYLGRELQKAEECILNNNPYIQD